jgi:glycosyltransferase involved in cell wall biosynthesis
MRKNKDLVSIVIPCYNNVSTIVETLNSIINQTYKNIEIVIIDDGSVEDIQTKIKHFINNNSVVLKKQENKGVSAARNYGASLAKGIYLLFIDADDMILPRYIEKCVSEFDQNPALKIVYSEARFFDRENGTWNLPKYIDFKNFLIGNCIFISALIKKEDFDNADGFDTSLDFYEDWDLWISILKKGGSVYQIPEELFLYRKHNDNSSASDKADNLKNIHSKNRLKIYNKHYDSFTEHFGDFEFIFLRQFEIKKLLQQLEKDEQDIFLLNKEFNKLNSLWFTKIYVLLKNIKNYFK